MCIRDSPKRSVTVLKNFSGESASVENKTFALVVSQYYDNITGNMKDGAVETLLRNRVPEESISIFWVPGSWELPHAALRLVKSKKFDAIVCLGCVIKGETTHDHHINSVISSSIGQISLEHDVPIGFGVLTCNTLLQALERSGGSVGNKGVESTEAVVQMLQLFEEIGKI